MNLIQVTWITLHIFKAIYFWRNLARPHLLSRQQYAGSRDSNYSAARQQTQEHVVIYWRAVLLLHRRWHRHGPRKLAVLHGAWLVGPVCHHPRCHPVFLAAIFTHRMGPQEPRQ